MRPPFLEIMRNKFRFQIYAFDKIIHDLKLHSVTESMDYYVHTQRQVLIFRNCFLVVVLFISPEANNLFHLAWFIQSL